MNKCTVRVHGDFLSRLCTGGAVFDYRDKVTVTRGIPAGAVLVGAAMDGDQTVALEYEHDSDDLADGAVVEVEFTAEDLGKGGG